MMSIRLFFFLCFSFIIFNCSGDNENDSLETNGTASYYHDNFQGLETSSGDVYDKNDFTAAHKSLPFNTFVHVTNKLNNKSVVVRINDRGPFVKSRIIDLARSPAQKIEMVPFGVVPVKMQVLDLLNYISDTLLKENDVWDCYGNREILDGITVYVWKSEYWKHAFYMASDVALDYNAGCVVVKTIGDEKHRFYCLLITGISAKNDAIKLVEKLKQDGFRGAKVMK